jgi:xanthine dehydrogenase accessory factor
MPQFYEQVVQALEAGEPFALGSSPASKVPALRRREPKRYFRRWPYRRHAGWRLSRSRDSGSRAARLVDEAARGVRSGIDHDFGWDDGLILRRQGLRSHPAARAGSGRDLATVAQRERAMTWGVRKDFSIAWVEQRGSETGPAAAGNDQWIYQEDISPPWALWIAGSGHVAQAVAPLAQQVDFDATVFDDRLTFASKQFFLRRRNSAWATGRSC